MKKNKFLIFYLSLLLVLNSCGFQLRKPLNLNYQSYAIIGDSPELTKLVHKQFSFTNIKHNKNGSADLVIEIMGNTYTKRILSLAGNGQIGEFELIQTIEYRFKTSEQWSEPRKLEAIREYTYEPILYNAAQSEERLLKESMIEQLSQSLISEINNLGN